MDWNSDKSVRLSKFCVYLFMVLLTALCVGAPWIFRWLITVRSKDLAGAWPYFLASTYTVAVPAAAALWDLHRLLKSIGAGDVFLDRNVAILRRLSWYCIAAGVIFLISSLYYMPFLMLAAAAAFVGLILRVVKNVFAEAVRLKTENDFTI